MISNKYLFTIAWMLIYLHSYMYSCAKEPLTHTHARTQHTHLDKCSQRSHHQPVNAADVLTPAHRYPIAWHFSKITWQCEPTRKANVHHVNVQQCRLSLVFLDFVHTKPLNPLVRASTGTVAWTRRLSKKKIIGHSWGILVRENWNKYPRQNVSTNTDLNGYHSKLRHSWKKRRLMQCRRKFSLCWRDKEAAALTFEITTILWYGGGWLAWLRERRCGTVEPLQATNLSANKKVNLTQKALTC